MLRPVCAIIGAGEGLGQALAKKFAHQGYNVAVISRSLEGSAKALNAVKQAGMDVYHFYADAQNPETIETAIGNVISEMGEIEVLIYNARGDFTACKPLEISYEQLSEVYNLEVVGAFAAAKSVLPKMIKKGRLLASPFDIFVFLFFVVSYFIKIGANCGSISPGNRFESPDSFTSTFFNICLKIVSICLSFMITPWSL